MISCYSGTIQDICIANTWKWSNITLITFWLKIGVGTGIMYLLLVLNIKFIPSWHIFVFKTLFVSIYFLLDSGIFHHRRRHLTSVPWQKSSDSELYKPYKLFGAKSKYKPDISQKFPWFICRDIVKLRPFTRNMLTLGNLFRT